MDREIMLNLLLNRTKEIEQLLLQFIKHPEDFNAGATFVANRIDELAKEFALVKSGFNELAKTKKQATENFEKDAESENQEAKEEEDLKQISASLPKESNVNIELFIGINDRFLFIRELFNNNEEDYKNGIEFANKSTSFQQVESYFRDVAGWDFEDSSVILFMDIVKRRF